MLKPRLAPGRAGAPSRGSVDMPPAFRVEVDATSVQLGLGLYLEFPDTGRCLIVLGPPLALWFSVTDTVVLPQLPSRRFQATEKPHHHVWCWVLTVLQQRAVFLPQALTDSGVRATGMKYPGSPLSVFWEL